MTEKSPVLEQDQELAVSAQMLLAQLEENPDLYEEARGYLEAKVVGVKAPLPSKRLSAFLKQLKQEAKHTGLDIHELQRELLSAIIVEDEEVFHRRHEDIRAKVFQKLSQITDVEMRPSDREVVNQQLRKENEHLDDIRRTLNRPENESLRKLLFAMVDKNIRLEESGIFDEEMTSFLNRAGLMENEALFYRLLSILNAERAGKTICLTTEQIKGHFHQLKKGDLIRFLDGSELTVSRNNPLQHKIYTDKGRVFTYGQAPGARTFQTSEYEKLLEGVSELRLKGEKSAAKAA